MSVDPLAQEFAAWSPYNYVLGNPLRYIDPDGRSADDIIIRTENISGDGYVDQVIIKSDKIDQTIDLPFVAPGSFNSLSLSPKKSDPIVIDIIDPVANLDLDGLIDKLTAEGTGEPVAAITISLGGVAAFKGGAGAEIMVGGLYLKGRI